MSEDQDSQEEKGEPTVMGLGLVQECKRTWEKIGEGLSYEEITRLASAAKPFLAVIDPDDSLFLHPGDMPERIRA